MESRWGGIERDGRTRPPPPGPSAPPPRGPEGPQAPAPPIVRMPGVGDVTSIGLAPWGSRTELKIAGSSDPWLMLDIPAIDTARRLTFASMDAVPYDATFAANRVSFAECGVWAGAPQAVPPSVLAFAPSRDIFRGYTWSQQPVRLVWPRGAGPLISPGEGVTIFCRTAFDAGAPLTEFNTIICITLHGYEETETQRYIAK